MCCNLHSRVKGGCGLVQRHACDISMARLRLRSIASQEQQTGREWKHKRELFTHHIILRQRVGLIRLKFGRGRLSVSDLSRCENVYDILALRFSLRLLSSAPTTVGQCDQEGPCLRRYAHRSRLAMQWLRITG